MGGTSKGDRSANHARRDSVQPGDSLTAPTLHASIQAAASSLAIQANAVPVHAKDEIESVLAEQARNPGGGVHRDA
jgi:hypothetical protein